MRFRALLLGALLLAILQFGRAQNAAAPASPFPKAPAAAGGASDLTPAASANIAKRVETFMRNLYAWGPDFEMKVGPIRPGPVADLYEVIVQVSTQGQSESTSVFVTKDARFLFQGSLQDMTQDPMADVKKNLHLEGAPSKGPADAKVVVVEFGDFECPICRQLDTVLRTMLPKYPQVRLVFKDFPLVEVHPWALTAAEAGHCALQKSQDTFWKLHDAIYDNQELISPENAFSKLGDLAEQAGVTADAYKTCMADTKTEAAVQKSVEEARTLEVDSTPTLFVDGRRLVGPSDTALEQYITFDLH